MITTKEFFKIDADNIILDLETYWTIQRDKNGEKYINVPLPDKEKIIKRYIKGLDDPFEELSDYDDLSAEEIKKLMDEQVKRISEVYDMVMRWRAEFENSLNKE